MKNVLTLLFLAFCFVGYGQIIDFPDANFKNALVNTICADTDGNGSIDSDADVNNDGEIEESEALLVKSLNVINRDIISLEGLNKFRFLTTLFCSDNKLLNLHVDNLDSLSTLDCSGNVTLNSLILNNLPKLSMLSCRYCGPTSLEFKDLPSLSSIDCHGNTSLNSLTLSNLPKLSSLFCSYTGLDLLDLVDLPEFTTLDCRFNESLRSLTLTNLPKLLSINCNESGLLFLELKDLPELTKLNCDKNKFLSVLNLAILPKLTEISCVETGLINLHLNDLPELTYLNCSLNKVLKSLSLINLPKFQGLSCEGTSLSKLDLKDLLFLTSIDIDLNYALKDLILINLPKLDQISCSYDHFNDLDFKDLPSLSLISIYGTSVSGILTLKNLPNLKGLSFQDANVKEVEINNLPALSSLGFFKATLFNGLRLLNLPKLSFLSIEDSNLSKLDIRDFPSLSTLQCYGNKQLNNLTLRNLPKLYNLICINSGYLSLELNDFPSLSKVECSYSNSLKLRLSNLPKLERLECDHSKITNLLLENLELLSYINFSYDTSLDSLTLADLPNLAVLQCDNSIIKGINLNNLPLLSYLYCSNIKSLDNIFLTNLPKLSSINCSNTSVSSIIMISDNILSEFEFDKNPNLRYICCSVANFALVENNIQAYGYINVSVSNYCSFDPFSDFGVLSGNVRFDVNNDGCDVNDSNLTNLKFNLTGLNTNVSYSFLGNKKYDISLNVGSFKITPKYEIQQFKVTPEFASVDIKRTDTITQDFCITPMGIFRQTNITVIPLSPPARPGFDASYKIVWENVGNQIESGTLNFTYDETLLDYISATQTADQVADGIIKWNFTNLLPFEKREITVTLRVNRPTDTPAVNAGDKLYLTASILDNIFTLENTVVGSYDPNDKTCLQGDRVKPDMVGEYVDYLIRFENTGNYAAENVVVKDIIDTKTFDVSTLQITDASHEVYTRIEGNKVEFIFENIQLPFDDAINDGYIAFKIKTLPSLVLGDSLKNLADIYFDYNFPIRTNEAQTTVALPVFTKDISTEVNIYPNPVTDIFYLDTNEKWSKAEIYDISGRIMRSITLDGQSIDVSGLESGTYFMRMKDGDRVGVVKFVKL